MTKYIHAKELVFLENGDVIHTKGYPSNLLIGNTSEVSTWHHLIKACGKEELATLATQVWSLVQTPAFIAIYEVKYDNSFRLLDVETPSDDDSDTLLSIYDDGNLKVRMYTTFPFSITEERTAQAAALIVEHKAAEQAKRDAWRAKKTETEMALLEALKAKLESNKSLRLAGEGDRLHEYVVEVLVNNVVITTVNAQDVVKELLPEQYQQSLEV